MKAIAGDLPRHYNGSEVMDCTQFLVTSGKRSEDWSTTVIEVETQTIWNLLLVSDQSLADVP